VVRSFCAGKSANKISYTGCVHAWGKVTLLGVIAGCRLGFDPLTSDHDASSDVGTDATADAGRDPCTLGSTIVCRDFKDGLDATLAIGDVTWLPTAGRTDGALRVRGAPNTGAFVSYVWGSAITTGPLIVRVYVRFTAGPPITKFAVLAQLDNNVDTNGLEKISVDLGDQDTYVIASPFSGGGGNSSVVAVREQWVCLRLQIDVDATGTTGRLQLAVDGAPVIDESPQLTMPPGGFLRAILNATPSSTDPAIEVLFDDLIVAREPVGC